MGDDTMTLPSTPDPNRVAQIAGQIRAALAIAAGFGLAVPTIGEAQLNGYVSAGLVGMSVVAWAATAFWSWRQHATLAANAHAGAVASADAGTPLKVVPIPLTA